MHSIHVHAQSCPTLYNPMNCSPPGSSVHGISQEEWGSGFPFPPLGDLPDPRIKPASLVSPALAGVFFTTGPPGKPIHILWHLQKIVSIIFPSMPLKQ